MVVGHVNFPLQEIALTCQKYHVRELPIFGSALRDDFRSDSDVDLLVDFWPGHGLGLIDYLSCQEALGELLGRKVDLVQKRGLKRFVREGIFAAAQVVYAA